MMRHLLFGLMTALSATGALAATPRIEPSNVADPQLTAPEIELAPIVIQTGASFMHAIVVDADISTIEIFEI